jgi:hypothetical protein
MYIWFPRCKTPHSLVNKDVAVPNDLYTHVYMYIHILHVYMYMYIVHCICICTVCSGGLCSSNSSLLHYPINIIKCSLLAYCRVLHGSRGSTNSKYMYMYMYICNRMIVTFFRTIPVSNCSLPVVVVIVVSGGRTIAGS